MLLYTTFKTTVGERDREHQKALNESRRRDLLRSGRSSPGVDGKYTTAPNTTLYLDAKPPSSEF